MPNSRLFMYVVFVKVIYSNPFEQMMSVIPKINLPLCSGNEFPVSICFFLL